MGLLTLFSINGLETCQLALIRNFWIRLWVLNQIVFEFMCPRQLPVSDLTCQQKQLLSLKMQLYPSVRKACKWCGSKTHSQRSHKDCPYNPSNSTSWLHSTSFTCDSDSYLDENFCCNFWPIGHSHAVFSLQQPEHFRSFKIILIYGSCSEQK